MTTAPSSPEVTPAAEGSAPTASPAHSLLVSAKDLAEWAAVSVVADGSTNRNLGSVIVSLAAGELRGVATDAKMLAVSRLFDRSQPAAPSASDSSGKRLHAVPSKPALRPAGHVGITSFRPHTEIAVSADRFAQIAAFTKELGADTLVEVEVVSHRLALSAGTSSLSLPVVSQSQLDPTED